MFLYNVHTPNKTFSLQPKEGESFQALVGRIATKTGLSPTDEKAILDGKDGAGLVYEFEAERWSLEDDDDLSILLTRIPPDSAPSATLHLTSPTHHAHFAPSPAPPAYSTASTRARATTKAAKAKSATTPTSPSSVPAPATNGKKQTRPAQSGSASESIILGQPYAKEGPVKSGVPPHGGFDASASSVQSAPIEKKKSTTTTTTRWSQGEQPPLKVGFLAPIRAGKAPSIYSTRSRRSKWGDDDAEPLGDVRKREWLDFHNHNGVRTVVGEVNGVPKVRMLLKSGYKQVYISREFAIKAGLVSPKYGMGSAGYTGLKTLGNVSITVGSHTASHPALINEEQHFDVVLGRQWLEKMAVKVDPLDPTILTYMDTGESIPCDIVVLKDDKGNVITVT